VQRHVPEFDICEFTYKRGETALSYFFHLKMTTSGVESARLF